MFTCDMTSEVCSRHVEHEVGLSWTEVAQVCVIKLGSFFFFCLFFKDMVNRISHCHDWMDVHEIFLMYIGLVLQTNV